MVRTRRTTKRFRGLFRCRMGCSLSRAPPYRVSHARPTARSRPRTRARDLAGRGARSVSDEPRDPSGVPTRPLVEVRGASATSLETRKGPWLVEVRGRAGPALRGRGGPSWACRRATGTPTVTGGALSATPGRQGLEAPMHTLLNSRSAVRQPAPLVGRRRLAGAARQADAGQQDRRRRARQRLHGARRLSPPRAGRAAVGLPLRERLQRADPLPRRPGEGRRRVPGGRADERNVAGLPRWLDRIIPDLQLEGPIEPVPAEEPEHAGRDHGAPPRR